MQRWLNIEIHEIHKLYEIHIGKAVNNWHWQLL